ncbi:MAG: hypothetical protein ABIC91_04505 [Nanoarchaeota archaeon]|nr:hypothetical protein [Nanoarchaeota archaeon]
MEQYLLPKELDFEHLRFCLDNYSSKSIFIRDCGGIRDDGKYHCEGLEKVNESLEGRVLDFKKDSYGLYILIDSDEVFHFPLKYYDSGFNLSYERFELSKDGSERIILLSRGFDPYDSTLPEPRTSMLRHVIDNHLFELSFKGRIDLEFHSWKYKPDWKYWKIV